MLNDVTFLSPDLWLEKREERNLVSNVSTGRRVLLNQEEVEELEKFAQGHRLSREVPAHRRFEDADLFQSDLSHPRIESVMKAVDRFLAKRLDVVRSKLVKLYPKVSDRLQKARELSLADIKRHESSALHTPNVVARDLNVLLDHVQTYLQQAQEKCAPFRFAQSFLSSTLGRPLPREDYEQQPCMPETTQRRVEWASTLMDTQSKGLILGDDDLLSLYWSQNLFQKCEVFELDEELLGFLAPKLSDHVNLQARDLTQGLPPEHHGLYDVILTDPMYERTGMDLFISCCSEGLSKRASARVLFTTRPDMIDDGDQFEERLLAAGLAIESVVKNFSRYRLPDFYRRKLIYGFHQSGVSPQLIQGLTEIPYLYADMFCLKRA